MGCDLLRERDPVYERVRLSRERLLLRERDLFIKFIDQLVGISIVDRTVEDSEYVRILFIVLIPITDRFAYIIIKYPIFYLQKKNVSN